MPGQLLISLAAQTEKATQEIASQITEVQNSVAKSVEAMGRIAQRMEEIDAYSTEIAVSVKDQSIVTGEISRNVAGAADGSKIVAGVLANVAAATTKTQTSVETVLSASAAVEQAAANLRGEVESFLKKVAV